MGQVADARHRTISTLSLEPNHCDAVLAAPTRVGRYELGETLGSGAMGVVHRAYDPDLGRTVAIKLLRTGGASARSAARLLREAQSMARLRHPNVVPIFDVGSVDGSVFIAMPLLEGGALRSWLRAGPRRLDDTLDRFVAAGRGLAAAHAAGLVHRDFKPDNVLLGADGEVQVADFGLARLASDDDAPDSPRAEPVEGESLTRTGDVLGTPAYMAPEQLCGVPSDARADQFSFCVALWEGVYGARPFPDPAAGDTNPLQARYEAIAAGAAVPAGARDRARRLGRTLMRGLALDPAERWPTLQALLDAIEVDRVAGRRRRLPWLVTGIAAALAVALALAATTRDMPGVKAPMLPLPTSELPSTRALARSTEALPRITERTDVKAASISPDGTELAVVANHSLVLRGLAPGATERVIIAKDVSEFEEFPSWSPDQSHLLVGMLTRVSGTGQTALVDVRTRQSSLLPIEGFAAFLSNTEIAASSPRRRQIILLQLQLGKPVASRRACTVPGDYTFLVGMTGMANHSIAVRTVTGDHQNLVFLDRDCRVRGQFSEPGLSGAAATDTGTLIALVHHDKMSDLVELDSTGAERTRRSVTGEFKEVLGRRAGIDYLLAFAPRSRLDRLEPVTQVGDAAPRTTLYSREGWLTFALAPHGDALAWIELSGFPRTRGALCVAGLAHGVDSRALQQAMALPCATPLDNAVTTAWSPDGQRLATVIDDSEGAAVVISNRAGGARQRLPLGPIERTARPVWLDDHRIAAQTLDRRTYRWFDLTTLERQDIVDRNHGSTYSLVRSPRDGTLAMWRIGPPGQIDARTQHLWLVEPGSEPRPLTLRGPLGDYLVPSWSNDGELFVRSFDTGVVSRVARGTGRLTPIAQLTAITIDTVYNGHLQPQPDGSFLSSEIDLGLFVTRVAPPDTAP